MPLTIVTTPGAVDANAYADLSEVLEVAAYRGTAGATFLGLVQEEQVQAIVTTAFDLDSLPWPGIPATPEQAMAWPRLGTDIPRAIVRANIEYAIASAAAFAEGSDANVLVDTTTPVERLKVGPVDLSFAAGQRSGAGALDRLPAIVQRLVAPLLGSLTGALTLERA